MLEQVICDCASVVAPLHQEVPDCYGPVAEQPESAVAAKAATTVKRHSYLTRHLLFGIPDFVYKDHPEIYPLMMDLVAAEAQSLFGSGLLISNTRYYVAFIGCKGDMRHHAQVVFNLKGHLLDVPSRREWLPMGGHQFRPFVVQDDVFEQTMGHRSTTLRSAIR